jgi:hypothetical protein
VTETHTTEAWGWDLKVLKLECLDHCCGLELGEGQWALVELISKLESKDFCYAL